MADELKARLSVDTSGFTAGMATAVDTTQEGAQRMASAMSRVKLETSALSESYRVFGQMAAAGNEQATKAIAEHIQATESAKKAVEDLKQSEIDAANAVREANRLKAIEQKRQYEEYIAASRQAEAATKGVTQSMYAAQGASELLRGRLPIRAFERLTAVIPGVSALLRNAFPVIGLIALGEMAFQAGKALYEAFDLGGERARKTQVEIRDVNNELERGTTSLEVQIDKLQQEQAKLEHKPFNGAKLVLDEAALAAENLAEKLDGVIKRELELMKMMAPTTAQSVVAGFTGNHDLEVMLQEHSKWLDRAKTVQDELNESTRYGNELHQYLNSLLEKQSKVAMVRSLPMGVGDAAEIVGLKDYSKTIEAARTAIALQDKEQINIKATIDLTKQEAATQHARDTHTSGAGAGKAEEEKLRQAELEYDRQRQAGNLQTLSEQREFWATYLSEFDKFGSEYKDIFDRITRIDEEGAKAAHSAIEKFKKDQATLANLKLPADLKPTKNDEVGEDALARESERGAVQAAELATQLDKQATAAALADGAITPLAAAQRNAADDAALLAAKIKAINEQIEEFKRNGNSWNEALGRFTDNKEQAQFLSLQNQRGQLQGQGQLQANVDTKAVQNAIEKPYLNAFNAIENGWLKVQRDMILGTGNIRRDFAQMGANLVVDFAANLEKMLAQQVLTEVKMAAAHRAAKATQQATDATAAAISQATTQQTAMKEIFTDAKSAAAGAYKAMAGIPVIGPELGAIAAGVTFAAVMALASFDVGTPYVPKTGVAMIHKGEQIVTESNNRELMDFVRSGSGSRSSTSNVRATINNHYNQPGRTPSAREQAAAVRDMVKRGHSL